MNEKDCAWIILFWYKIQENHYVLSTYPEYSWKNKQNLA